MRADPSSSVFDLSGRVALVTGGNGGIGLGMAKGLAEAGADVAIWGTNEAKNTTAREELEALGVRVFAARCDVSDEAQVEAAFAGTLEALGKVDAVFANAGVAPREAPFVDQTVQEWRRVMSINLEGAFLTLRAAARHMVERGEGGSLVGVSSLAALQGQPKGQPYTASKAGLIAMMNSLAVELARHGIRANSVLPGFIRTDMTPFLDDERVKQHVLRRVPARRWGEPSDFAGIAVYLAGDASAYHTGQEFLVDGGYLRF